MTDLRRRYTAEIVSNEARMKQAQEAAGIVTWEWNLITDEIVYSGNCDKLYGREIHSNDEFWEILHPDEAGWLNPTTMQDAIASSEPRMWDFRIVLPDGKVRWIESRTATLRDDAGRPTRMIGTTIDISEHKETELALQRHVALLSEAEILAGHGSWQWHVAHDALIVSDQWRRLFDLAPAAAPFHYRDFAGYLHPDDRAIHQAAIDQARKRPVIPSGVPLYPVRAYVSTIRKRTRAHYLAGFPTRPNPAHV